MNFALVGATGFIGAKILAEAVSRGHTVTALCRHPSTIIQHAGVRAACAEVTDTAALCRQFQGQEAIVHSYAPARDPEVNAFVESAHKNGDFGLKTISLYTPRYPLAHDASVKARIDAQTAGTRSIIQAAKIAGVKRILAVGGAGTLLVDGVRCMDRPDFPKAFEGGAKSTAIIKELLREEPAIEWTVLCPSMVVMPGQRTGRFRLGLDDLLTAADGSSSISLEDYAVAMIDELERPAHVRQRFTVGY
jgi:putative NADH-flavin reductase